MFDKRTHRNYNGKVAGFAVVTIFRGYNKGIRRKNQGKGWKQYGRWFGISRGNGRRTKAHTCTAFPEVRPKFSGLLTGGSAGLLALPRLHQVKNAAKERREGYDSYF